MDWIKTLVPLLGTALGTPLGGVAVSYIASKLNLGDSTVDKVTNLLKQGELSPEQIVALKEAELNFSKFLEDNKIKLEELAVNDRNSARQMQITVKSITPSVLTYLITVGFFGVLAALMSGAATNTEPLLIMLGSLSTAWIAAITYWFGSTNGSQMKTDLLAKADSIQTK